MKILVTETISEEGINLLRAEHEVDTVSVTPDKLLDIIHIYDALITRSQTKVTREVLEKGINLKVVGRAGVGVDNIDVEAATERGIVVVNVPGANTLSTAEHTIGLLISLARHIPQAHYALTKQSKWDRKTYLGTEIYNKTLGIIGLGRIGSEVASRAQAFGMKVLAYDPFVSEIRAKQLGVTLVNSLAKLLPEVDFLTIHAAKTKDTATLIKERELRVMKKGAYLVNCARGGMVDEDALLACLENGHLRGAALDVFAQEPCTGSPLFKLPNVIATPHLSASTVEAQNANGLYIAQYVLKALKGELVPEAVNLPQVPKDEAGILVDHLPLAEAMGSFLAQAFMGTYDTVEVTYTGALAQKPTTLITNTILKGILSVQLGENVNYINAPALAHRRGIRVHENHSQTHAPLEINNDYKPSALAGSLSSEVSLITVRLAAPRREHRLAGMLRRDGGIRFVAIDGLYLDMTPSRYMLVSRHKDQPGMIGRIGTALGAHNINIASMHLGRTQARGEAIMVMLLDDPVTPGILDELHEATGYIEVRFVIMPKSIGI